VPDILTTALFIVAGVALLVAIDKAYTARTAGTPSRPPLTQTQRDQRHWQQVAADERRRRELYEAGFRYRTRFRRCVCKGVPEERHTDRCWDHELWCHPVEPDVMLRVRPT